MRSPYEDCDNLLWEEEKILCAELVRAGVATMVKLSRQHLTHSCTRGFGSRKLVNHEPYWVQGLGCSARSFETVFRRSAKRGFHFGS